MSEKDRDIDARVENMTGHVIRLRAEVGRIVEQIQAVSGESARALQIYPRTKRLLTRVLGRASRYQHRACSLGRRLLGYESDVADLLCDVEHLEWQANGKPSPELRAARTDLRGIEETIRRWSMPGGEDAEGGDDE
jgi:hypothetical protein